MKNLREDQARRPGSPTLHVAGQKNMPLPRLARLEEHHTYLTQIKVDVIVRFVRDI